MPTKISDLVTVTAPLAGDFIAIVTDTGAGVLGTRKITHANFTVVPDGHITTVKIADLNVTTGKIAAAAVTKDKQAFSYSGRIAANGSAVSLPAGWTSSRTAAGKYTITHGLGDVNYVVLVDQLHTIRFHIFITGINDNTFTIHCMNSSVADTDMIWIFTLNRY